MSSADMRGVSIILRRDVPGQTPESVTISNPHSHFRKTLSHGLRSTARQEFDIVRYAVMKETRAMVGDLNLQCVVHSCS